MQVLCVSKTVVCQREDAYKCARKNKLHTAQRESDDDDDDGVDEDDNYNYGDEDDKTNPNEHLSTCGYHPPGKLLIGCSPHTGGAFALRVCVLPFALELSGVLFCLDDLSIGESMC
ncbi:hypothetical protein STEG23_015503 [Scotinomys teguina]